ncbi:hypothetical protein MMPV_005762 [Pyropia vietnamensis]
MNEAGGFGGEGVGPITAAGVAAGAGGAAQCRRPHPAGGRAGPPHRRRVAQGHVPLPPATSASASAASVEAEFADLLADAAEFGDGATVPRGVTREAVREAIRCAPRAAAPGPSGLRPEHLWALERGGQDALVGVVELLVSAAAVTRVPAAAAHALAGADLLLLAKPGGVGGDGLPGLRPIGMPETLRKLAASALAATVRKAAAAFLAPAQLGVGVPSACERLVHELDAHLAHHPQHAVVQLDYRNAFNLVSRPAAAAVLRRALPLSGSIPGAPTVYGWAAGGEGADGDAAPGGGAGDANGGDDGEGADGGDDDGVDGENGGGGGDGGDDDGGDDGGGGRDAATGGARGAQQGDPLGPLLHAAALWLVLRRLQDRHPGVLVRAFHDDVVAAGTPGELAAVMADAAAAGASVDAELAPTKCTGWSPAGAPAPAGWGGTDQRRLVAAIAALPPEELQSQLLLLRLCAGPRANYWLRCLPLEAAARLAAAVDADAKAALGGMLCDARDSTATREAVLERAALPPAMGGLGVGGRTRVVPAALLASWVDALRAGQAYSPALRATADGLLAVPRVAADGGPLPPVAVAPAAPPPDCGPWLSHEGRQGASAPPAVRSARSAGAPPRSGGPLPPSTPDRRAPAAAALRQALLSLLAAHAAHCAAPPSGLLWSMARGGPNSAADAAVDPLAPPPPPPLPHPEYGAGATTSTLADGPHSPAPYSPPTWQSLLGGEAPAAQRDLSRPAHAAARARIYAELSGWRRAGMAACQGGGAARWLSALPTSGTAGTAIPGAGMRVAVRLWLGAPPRSVPPAPRCRCGRDADADGRHFLSACPEQSSGHVRLHHHIVHLVVEALRRTPSWGAVEAEAVVERGRGALRPDLRATHASSGAVVWADASVTAPFGPRTTAPTAASPLRAVAAEAREREKVAKYANALPGPPASHTFTPLVWEAYGRIGPATAKWLRGAMRGPALSGVRSTLLTPAAAEGATGGWAEVVRRGRRRRGRGPLSPISDGPGGATTTALQHRGGTGSGGGGAQPCAVAASGAGVVAAAGGGAASGCAGGAVGGGEAAWASSVGGHGGPPTPMADPPAGPRRAADGDFRGTPLATADARAAAAAAELRRVRRRPADAPTLATVYVAGVSRDVRQHRMRTLLADVTGVDVHSIVDVDRFGATTAVTVVAAAAEGFRAAVGKGRAATVLRLLPTADPWAPALLGAARRRGLSAEAAAAAAAGFCRRRLEGKLAQLPARVAMPPHLRVALHAHIQGMLSSHTGGGTAPASPSGSAAHRSLPPPASAAARMLPAERATGAAATMPSAPTPTGGAPVPGPTTAAPDGPESPARGDAMADVMGAAVARPFAPGRGADRLGPRSAAALAAVPAKAASPSAASTPRRRSWVRRRPPAAAPPPRAAEAAERLPPLPPPPSPPPPGAARAAAFAASVALPLVAAARKRAAAARSRSPAPRARTTRRQVRLALAVARLGAAPASPARLAGRRTRGAAAAARVAAASPPPTPRAPKRARLRPPPTSPQPALGAATPAEARRPAPPPPCAAIPGHDEPGMAAHASAEGHHDAVCSPAALAAVGGAGAGRRRAGGEDSAASAADAADSTAASAATPTAEGGEPGPPSACPVAGCRVLLRGDIANRGGLAHLSLAHVIGEVPEEVATALGLGGCRWCGRPYRSQRGPRGRSSLSAHEALCRLNPRRQRARAAPVATPSADGGTAGDAAEAGAAPTAAAAGGGTALFFADPPAWAAARAAFLRRVAPAGADWAPLVASGARTAAHVPAALLRAWRVLATDSLDWVRREPEQQHAWLWLLLLPSLLRHTPSTAPAGAPDAPRPPLLLPARAEAVLNGEFSTALADRNAEVWRPSWRRCLDGRRRETRPAAFAARGFAPSQRRALRLVRAGRLSAAARTLLADEPAPHTAAVWRKAASLFPPATSASASAASVEAGFADLLADAAELGDGATVPRGVTREAVREAIRCAPRAAAPGPSGLRPEHLWALERGGQDALVGVVELLVSAAAVTRVPAAAAHALAGADLLLLAKPGGVGGDGLPGLRPIGMPETLRKLAASALAATVRKAAAAFLAPAQLGVGVPSACERLVHELEAQLAHHPQHAVVQLDYRNAFNLVSRPAAAAVLRRALPPLSPYLEWVYGGGEAPTVYGWAAGCESASGDAAPGGAGSDANGGDDGDGADGDGADGDGDDGDGGENVGGGGDGGDAENGDDGGGGHDAAPGRGVAPPAPPSSPPPPPPTRLALRAERGAQQGDPLGPLLHAAALWLVLRRLQDRHPGVLVRAFHDDVVAAGTPGELAAVMADAAAVGASVDAELAPTKCTGWSPAGAPAPAGWGGKWAAEGVVQFSVPLGGHAHVAAGVDRLVADQRRLVAAIAALPPEELQSQLLLLRLCAGPRANYWLRCLPLEAAARLAAAVDADAKAALGGMLCDARDSTATREAVLERAALPPAMGGLGVGGRTRIVPAALLAPWVDALRAGQAYSPALRATADGLLAVPRVAADGGLLPPVVAAPAARPPDCGPRPPHDGRQGASVPPAVRAVRPAGAPPRSGGPPPPSAPDRGAPAAAALRQALLSLLAAHAAHSGMAACQGCGAARWLSALPTPGTADTAIPGAGMRVAARLWLGAPPRSVPPAPRCRCGRDADADGRHFLSACPEQSSGHVRLHHHIVHLVVEALRRTPSWGAVEAEAVVERGRGALRPDLRATHASSGAVVWADASVTAPFGPRTTAPTAASPLRPVAAEAREREKVAKYANALPGPPASHTFTPLVWEAYGRIGPATAKWLRGAMRGPALSGPDRARMLLLERAVVAVLDASGVAATTEARVGVLTAICGELRAPIGSESGVPANRGPDSALSAEMAAPIALFAPSSAPSGAAGGLRGPACVPPPPVGGALELLWLVGVLFVPVAAERVSVAVIKVELDPSLVALPAGGAAAAEGATGGWAEVVRRGRRRRGRGPLSPISDGPGGATTTALQHRGGTGSGGGGAQPCAVAASGAGVVAAAGGGAAKAAWASSVGGHGGPPTPMADPPAGPRRAADGDFRGTPLATADARAAAAAAELRRVRRRPADAPTLATVYVAGVSRDVRQHRMRTLLADVTGVDVHSIVDVDRFGATTAVTVVAAAAEGFRAAVGKGRAATVLRLLPTADPWAPALLGAARRRGLSAEAAAAAAAGFCRRRLEGKLAQLPARVAMPPHLRVALHAHIQGMLESRAGGVAAPASPAGGTAHHPPSLPAHHAVRPPASERTTGAAATMRSAPAPTSGEPAPGPPTAASSGLASAARADAMVDAIRAAVARPFAAGRGAEGLRRRSATAKAAVPVKAASPPAARPPRRRSWVRRPPPAAASLPRSAEAAERLPPLPPPPSPPPPGAARAAAFAASVALPLCAAARKRAAAARSRSPAPRARTPRRRVRLALAVARLGAAPASPARLAGRRTRAAATVARVAAASPPPTPRAPKRARLRPPPTSPPPALGAASPAAARRPAPPPLSAAIPGHWSTVGPPTQGCM